eukprot:358810-Chlamydomonas_euryale.AAC.1
MHSSPCPAGPFPFCHGDRSPTAVWALSPTAVSARSPSAMQLSAHTHPPPSQPSLHTRRNCRAFTTTPTSAPPSSIAPLASGNAWYPPPPTITTSVRCWDSVSLRTRSCRSHQHT